MDESLYISVIMKENEVITLRRNGGDMGRVGGGERGKMT